MFTGIIQAMGTIRGAEPKAGDVRLEIDLSRLGVESIGIGDSVAVNGVCLTVVALEDYVAAFDVSKETLAKTLMGDWQADRQVNLELALTPSTPLGGHLVSGHVDGVGRVLSRTPEGGGERFEFLAPQALGCYIAPKGSISIDGVSLTTNEVVDEADGTRFGIMLVPHTLSVTTLGGLQPGDGVHLEIDLLARYLKRMLDAGAVDSALLGSLARSEEKSG